MIDWSPCFADFPNKYQARQKQGPPIQGGVGEVSPGDLLAAAPTRGWRSGFVKALIAIFHLSEPDPNEEDQSSSLLSPICNLN